MNRTLLLIVAVVAAAVAGVAAWYASRDAGAPAPAVVAPPAPPPSVAAPAPAIEHPVAEAPAAAASQATDTVALDHSDATVRTALADIFAGHALPAFLRPDRIVRNIVATVDALPRDSVSPTVNPIEPVTGRMAVTADASGMTVAADNDDRYAPYVEVMKAIDSKAAARFYVGHYALFQQAYQELGYPNGYFNDRLVKTIDVLLATPEVNGPLKVEQPKVVYIFADPALEALPAGQKAMLRLGPRNAAAVKAKLREFRAQIVRATPAQ